MELESHAILSRGRSIHHGLHFLTVMCNYSWAPVSSICSIFYHFFLFKTCNYVIFFLFISTCRVFFCYLQIFLVTHRRNKNFFVFSLFPRTWQIENTPFSLCVVVPKDAYDCQYSEGTFVAPIKAHYHMLDLMSDSSVLCRHVSQYATPGTACVCVVGKSIFNYCIRNSYIMPQSIFKLAVM